MCRFVPEYDWQGTVWRILDDLEAIGDAPPVKNRCEQANSKVSNIVKCISSNHCVCTISYRVTLNHCGQESTQCKRWERAAADFVLGTETDYFDLMVFLLFCST